MTDLKLTAIAEQANQVATCDAIESDVAQAIQHLSASWQTYRPIIERRQFPRLKYSAPLRIVPIDNHSCCFKDAMLEATGRDLSEQGISFQHSRNIPERNVLVCLGQDEVTKVYQVNLRWSRYRGERIWISGGQFERTYSAIDAKWNEILACFSAC